MFVSQVSSVSNNMIILPFPVKDNVTELLFDWLKTTTPMPESELSCTDSFFFFLLKANERALLLTFILHICLVFFFGGAGVFL